MLEIIIKLAKFQEILPTTYFYLKSNVLSVILDTNKQLHCLSRYIRHSFVSATGCGDRSLVNWRKTFGKNLKSISCEMYKSFIVLLVITRERTKINENA